MKLKVKSILTVLMYLYFVSVSIFNFSAIYLSSAIIFCIVALGINIYLKKIKWSYFFSFQLIFCLYEIIMIYLGKSVSSSLSKSATMTVLFNMIISLAMFSVFESKADVKEFFKKVSILSVAILIFIIVYTGGKGQDGRLAHNVARPFSDTGFTAIEVGMIAVWGSLSALYMYYKTGQKKYMVFQALYWIVIIWSGSRDCFSFGLLAVLIMYFINGKKDNIVSKIKKVLIISTIAIIAIIAIMKIQKLYDIIGYRFIGYFNGTETSANSREVMHKSAVNLIKNNWIYGYGLDTFRTFNGSFGTWSHNNYLELLLSGGIILLVIYYLPIVITIIKLVKIKSVNWREEKCIGISLIVLKILHDIVGVTYMSRMSNIFLLITIIIVEIYKKENLKNERN